MELSSDRVILLGLANECPLVECEEECPFRMIRKMPLRNRYVHVGEMTSDEVHEMVTHHHHCLYKREK